MWHTPFSLLVPHELWQDELPRGRHTRRRKRYDSDDVVALSAPRSCLRTEYTTKVGLNELLTLSLSLYVSLCLSLSLSVSLWC